MIWEQSNCWPEVEGIVFWTVARGRRPRATVQNTIPDTEGQLFDCSKIHIWNNCFITWSITVLTVRAEIKEQENSFANMLIIKLFSWFNNLLTMSHCQHFICLYVFVLFFSVISSKKLRKQSFCYFKLTKWRQSTRGKQSKLLTGQQFANIDVFIISENSKKYQITFI